MFNFDHSVARSWQAVEVPNPFRPIDPTGSKNRRLRQHTRKGLGGPIVHARGKEASMQLTTTRILLTSRDALLTVPLVRRVARCTGLTLPRILLTSPDAGRQYPAFGVLPPRPPWTQRTRFYESTTTVPCMLSCTVQ